MKLSGILPTRGRQEWALAAALGFFAQEWDGEKQLVIIDDEEDQSFDIVALAKLPGDYRLMWAEAGAMIGRKHNLGADAADDGYLMHIDSDDWSRPTRALAQLALLESSGKAVCGFHSLLFFDETTGRVYRLNGPAQQCAFGTTLMYRRDWWKDHRFNEQVKLGEDNRFVAVAREAGQLITEVAGHLMVARIHPGNTGPKMPQFWEPMNLSDLPKEFPA